MSRNIDTVVGLEEEQEQRITRAHRFSEAIGKFARQARLCHNSDHPRHAVDRGELESERGVRPFRSLSFSVAWNGTGARGGAAGLLRAHPPDAYERKGRSAWPSRPADQLLAEKEATKAIQMLQRMSHHLGIKDQMMDPEVKELSKDTEVEDVAHELQENLQNKTVKNGK
jgi:hypothetical protein